MGTLDALVARAPLDAPALLGLALALRAVGAAGLDDTASVLADAGRAVALVDDERLPALDRCTVLVVSAAAYNTLSLWELVSELYDRATGLEPEVSVETFARTADVRARLISEAVAATDWSRVAVGLSVRVSIGIAVAVLGPDRADAADGLYRAADADLYASKSSRARRGRPSAAS